MDPLGGPTISGTCANFYAAFGTQLQNGGRTAAQALAGSISCRGNLCPDDNRVNEFYILEKNINIMKSVVLSYTNAQAGEGLPDYSSVAVRQDWATIGTEFSNMTFLHLLPFSICR